MEAQRTEAEQDEAEEEEKDEGDNDVTELLKELLPTRTALKTCLALILCARFLSGMLGTGGRVWPRDPRTHRECNKGKKHHR